MTWDQKPRKRGHPNLWLGLGIVAAVISAVFSAPTLMDSLARTAAETNVSSGDRSFALGAQIGEVLGSSLAIGAVIWAVVYLLVVRRTHPRRGPAYFLVLFLVPLALEGLILAGVRHGGSDRDSDAEMRVAARELSQTMRLLATTPDPAKLQIDVRPKAHGMVGEFEGGFKQLIADMLADSRAYRAEIDALDLRNPLKPQALVRPGAIAANRAKIAQARKIVAKYSDRMHARLDQFHTKVEAMKAPEDIKRGFLDGYAKGMRDNGDKIVRVWRLEDETFAEIDLTLADLAHPVAPWRADAKGFVFNSPVDLQRWQGHVATLRRERDESLAMKQGARERAAQGADKIDEDVR
jgi:hypothetical protein